MSDRNLNIFVHFGYGFDAEGYKERFRRGESLDYTPYDLHLAEGPGVRVTFSTDAGRRPPGRIARMFHHRLRFAVDQAWHNRRAIAASDAIWTMSENEAFAVAALMMMRLVPRRPIVGTAIWLFNEWSTISTANRALFRLLSPYIDVLAVHSQGCVDIAASTGLRTSVELVRFGINEEAHAPPQTRPMARSGPIRILAAGNDLTRDWPTLLAAFGNDPRFLVSVWTRALGPDDVARVGNLRLPKPVTREEILAMYVDADVIVVPMAPNLFSGITVALEAAALEKPVIASATGGVPTYFSDGEVRLVPPGDATALREAVLTMPAPQLAALAARARARFDGDRYTRRGMVARYLAVIRRVLGAASPA